MTRKHSVFSNLRYLLRDVRREKPGLLVRMILSTAAAIIAPVFGIYLPKITVDLLTRGASAWEAIRALLPFAAALVLTKTVGDWASLSKYMEHNAMRGIYRERVFRQSLYCDYGQVESAEGQARYQKAQSAFWRGDASASSRMMTAACAICASLCSFVFYSSIIAYLNPLIILALIALSAVNYFALRAARRYEMRRRDEGAALERKFQYLIQKGEDIALGKDVRLFGMSGWFVATRIRLLEAIRKLNRAKNIRHALAGAVNAFTLFLRDGGAYAYLIYLVTQGQIGAGDFVLYFGAVTGFGAFVSGIVGSVNEMLDGSAQFSDMRDFLENSSASEPKNPIPKPSGNLGIRMSNVSFSYDGETNALSGVDLDIQPGEKIALVGANGAGKTTLVKLLCGLYAPGGGEIRIGDADVTRLARADLFSLISAVFQDATILPYSILENVALQPIGQIDESRAARCLKAAGLWDKVSSLPGGMRAVMTKKIDPEGVTLSGGETQKLLMARAIYKDAPILILDEPTSALDPIAESETYERFYALSKNRTAIFISHRLASTRFCDRVALIEDGKIAELGTHEELLAQGGSYAKLYEIQSHYYKQSGEAAQ